MATRRYGLSRGETEFQVTEGVGSATASDNIELTVDLAVSLTKNEVILALEMLQNWILKGNWPPA
ncbi:MAG TPA: hypothetical protein PKW79_00065 [Rhabdochlamydiaceae bacterium]|nr:hypothetical protein [Rhabdochlamydiaceae bacterium]